MVKLFSLLISFLLVFGSVAPSYAQTKGSSLQKKTTQPAKKETFFEKQRKAMNAALEGVVDSAKLEKGVTETVQKEKKEEDDTYWVNLGASFVKESCHIRGIPCILDRLDKAEQEAGGDILKAAVCSDKEPDVCVSALAYAQGGVHYSIQNFLYYQGHTIVESAGNFAHLVTEYGLHSEKDRQDAMKYFYDVLSHTDEDCGSGFPIEYGSSSQRADQRLEKDRKFQLCSAEVGAMPALAMLGKTQAENKKIAETIYAILEEYYSATSASIVISGATTALGILGTPRAYGLLEEFLMDETIPSTVGNALNSLSFSGMTQNMLRVASNIRGGDSRYLNRINESFQYLDNQELTRQGFQSALFEGEAIQYPYGNLLEDVGRMIGEQSATNANARRVAKVIISKANQYAKDGTHAAGAIHYPVVLGIMDAYRTFGKKYIYEPAPELVSLFYKGDWFDINEGTQQRVHYKAYQFAKARGWTYKAPTRDNEKIQRYIYNSRLMSMGEIADLVSMVFIAGGLVKAVPALLKGIPSAVRTLSARKTWIGTKNYIKTLPRRTVKQVKIAPAKAKRGATRRVESAKAAVSSRAQKVQAAASRFKNKVTGKKSPAASGETTAGATSSAARGETVGAAQEGNVTGAVQPQAIETEILSPLDAHVEQSKLLGTPYAERSLIPKTKTELPKGQFPDRADGLVHMEKHPTHPNTIVCYYADDFGNITVKETTLAQYESTVGSMSEMDQAILARRSQLFKAEVDVVRKNREYDRVTDMQRRINEIRREEDLAARSTQPLSQAQMEKQLARMRELKREREALEGAVEHAIKDMQKNGLGSSRSIRTVVNNSAEIADPVTPSAAKGPAKYADRSLVPHTSTTLSEKEFVRLEEGDHLIAVEQSLTDPNVTLLYYADDAGNLTRTTQQTLSSAKRAGWKRRMELDMDHLTYAEVNPTNPNTAVLYYADDLGNVRTAEVELQAYEEMAGTFSETEKALLSKRAQINNRAISAIRKDREYDRVTDMQRRINEIRREEDLAAHSTQPLSPAQFEEQFARMRALKREREALESAVEETLEDMQKNGLGSKSSIRTVVNNSAEIADPVTPSVAKGPVKYADRSLMPKPKKAIDSKKLAAQNGRKDGLTYMEKHPSDPNKVVLYYVDEINGTAFTREVPLQEYDQLVGAMNDVDKAVLGQSADFHAGAIATLRQEREYDRLTAIQKRINEIKRMEYEANHSGTALSQSKFQTEFTQMRRLSQERKGLKADLEAGVRDMVSNGLGEESSIRMSIQYYGEETGTAQAAHSSGVTSFTERSLMPQNTRTLSSKERIRLSDRDRLISVETSAQNPESAVFYYADDAGNLTFAKEMPMNASTQQAWKMRAQLNFDDLAYVEKNASNPDVAVLYYVDEQGVATAKEVSMSSYQKMAATFTETDKALLAERGNSYEKTVSALRKEREYDRAIALQSRIHQINQLSQAAASSSTRLGKSQFRAQFSQMRALQEEKTKLATELERTIHDMVANGFGSENSVRTTIYNSVL